ncbi:MAG TPA: efflux RND transporter permease subunit [Thermoanaerobaculia bacterium]|nr:efflux RND transporter permease subunit [Thermoanaerobaculia bacterium]
MLRPHGTEIERPLAIAMIGGLATSTLFTLFALPTFHAFVHHWQEKRRARRAARSPSSAIGLFGRDGLWSLPG